MRDKGPVFLEGHKTILRPPEKATDLETCMRWINDPEIRQFVLSFLPQDRKREEAWFDKMNTTDTDIALAIVAKPELRLIGLMGLHRIEWKNRVACTGALIGDPDYRNKGFGSDAKMALLEYAFHELGLNKVTSNAFATNPRSVAYSQKCGYRVEGRRRQQMFKGGRFIDLVELGVLRREWEPVWRRWRKTGKVS
jgi:RimJ/RimL family protein N-acetyltransferase